MKLTRIVNIVSVFLFHCIICECFLIVSYLLLRYLKAWVLDATPGKVRAGGDGEDHPEELISFLSTLPKEVDL